MPSPFIIVQQPQGPASQLVLLMHGVGSVPESMLGVAHWFASRDSHAMVVSIASPDPSDISTGLQWFSVRGVTEDNRQARVDAAMPSFVATVQHWQRVSGADAAHTLIAGFSQGAIMALESTKLAAPPALSIVAIAGRFATLPGHQSNAVIHLLHGNADPVMPAALAQAAQTRLEQLGTRVTLDVVQGVGHEPHPALMERLAARF
ncbi:phospholipase/carboxylesterase [Polaromonas sp. YR568]|uniref:esterase n=1 Tax=Polaromonas sp. YR568 TaxID=1855301 RepID=UPI0008F1CE55|nr:esterase [Polaromonas sp. YR568]SFU66602.1 phospholipase/carboxylesterase [Polaromonas sp. YR568]